MRWVAWSKRLPLFPHGLVRRNPDREGYRSGQLVVHRYFETVRSRMFQRHVKDQDRPCFYLGDPRRRLGERHRAVAADDFTLLLVDEPNLHLVFPEFGPATFQAHHEVESRVDHRQLLHPNVLEDSQNGELAVMVDEGVIAQ